MRGAGQFAIALFRHPARSRQMRVMNMAATPGIVCGIEAEEDLDGFLPRGAIARGIEQTQIERHVLTIIVGERLADWRFVEE